MTQPSDTPRQRDPIPTVDPPTKREIGRLAATRLVHETILRLLVSRARVIGLGALGAVAIVIGWAVGISAESGDRIQNGADLMSSFGLAVVVPVVTLVFATAGLGDLREDRTLVYLWLRPLGRGSLAVGAFAAALTVSAPLVLIPLVAAIALTGAGGEVVWASAVAGAVAVVAYCSLFTLVGLVLKRALLWGLAYVLIWEGFVAAAGAGAARLAIRTYSRSIVYGLSEAVTSAQTVSLAAAFVVPALVAITALAATAWRLARMEID